MLMVYLCIYISHAVRKVLFSNTTLMSNYLFVPIGISALHTSKGQSVIAAHADFSKLPYNNGKEDINPDVAFISEEIVREPFDTPNLHLTKGLHLHWTLPHALGAELINQQYPCAPNRFIVLRVGGIDAGTGQPLAEKKWCVQSDYISLTKSQEEGNLYSSSIPLPLDVKKQPNRQAFAYIGRFLPLDKAVEPTKKQTWEAYYKQPFTILGYGNPTFSSFYPNCRNVFGFYDEEIVQFPKIKDRLVYYVYGYYSDKEKDPFRQFIDANASLGNDALIAKINKEFKWKVDVDKLKAPTQLIFGGKICFNGRISTPDVSKVKLSVGNTGTEALSAYIANTLSANAAEKQTVEEQLESVLVAEKLDKLSGDLGTSFFEARHSKAFKTFSGGLIWTIHADMASGTDKKAVDIFYSHEAANLLSQLNQAQQNYEQALSALLISKRQLFADWYKFMLSCYPPLGALHDYPNIDAVREFLLHRDIKKITENEVEIGVFVMPGTGTKFKLGNKVSKGSLAAKVCEVGNQLLDTLKKEKSKDYTLVLQKRPAPQFRAATDPVVLIDGLPKLTSKHKISPGLLTTSIIPDNKESSIRTLIDGLPESISETKSQSWNPFIMEWETEIIPFKAKTSAEQDYQLDYLQKHFSLKDGKNPDWELPGADLLDDVGHVYKGETYLSDAASSAHVHHLQQFLMKQLKVDAISKLDKAVSNYTKPAKTPFNDIVYTACQAYTLIKDKYVLSQSFGGFNQALLMYKNTMQMPIADPLGFAINQNCTNLVATAVGEAVRIAPTPHTQFLPLRGGAMRMLRLRLADNFGQCTLIDQGKCNEVVPSETFPDFYKQKGWFGLLPRITQPSRLYFRWLDAKSDFAEMNLHPSCSPICGWLLVNKLDGSLLVYAPTGKILGFLDVDARWNNLPDNSGKDSVDALKAVNEHLYKTVQKIQNGGATFLSNFIISTGQALLNIAPPTTYAGDAMALLMGKPMALVRTSLSIELMDGVLTDQSWSSFRNDLSKAERTHHRYAEVGWPIRLGEYKKMNDGLIGFWREDGNRKLLPNFYCPANHTQNFQGIVQGNDYQKFTYWTSPQAGKSTFCMLVEPHSSVHASTGFLPVKSISIPESLYLDAISRMEVYFLNAPILTPIAETDSIRTAIPKIPDKEWIGLDIAPGQINTVAIKSPELAPDFSSKLKIFEGWLKLKNKSNNNQQNS